MLNCWRCQVVTTRAAPECGASGRRGGGDKYVATCGGDVGAEDHVAGLPQGGQLRGVVQPVAAVHLHLPPLRVALRRQHLCSDVYHLFSVHFSRVTSWWRLLIFTCRRS